MPILPQGRHCCGCSACFSACPHDSITMAQDFEGFYYPSVDPATCTECKSCEIACPTLPYLDFSPYDNVKKKSRFPYDVASDGLDSRGIFVHYDKSAASYFDALESSAKSSLDSASSSATSAISTLMNLDSAESSSTSSVRSARDQFAPPPPLLLSA